MTLAKLLGTTPGFISPPAPPFELGTDLRQHDGLWGASGLRNSIESCSSKQTGRDTLDCPIAELIQASNIIVLRTNVSARYFYC